MHTPKVVRFSCFLVVFALVITSARPGALWAQTGAGEHAEDVCDVTLGRLKTHNISMHYSVHTLVCARVMAADTGGQPISLAKLKVRFNNFMDRRVNLADQNGKRDFEFLPVRDEAGLYVARLPIAAEDELQSYTVSVQADSYLPATVGRFKFSRRTRLAERVDVKLVRDFNQWKPKFAYSEVSQRIKDLVGRSSTILFLPVKQDVKTVEDFVKTFDKHALDDKFPEFPLARAGMLNLLYVLEAESKKDSSEEWFRDIKQILAIGQERIVVEVEPKMFDKVEALAARAQRDPHGCSEYREADSSLHGRNFEEVLNPGQARSPKAKVFGLIPGQLISVKAPQCRGNIQLTVGRFAKDSINSVNRRTVADIDFDENFSFLDHATDVLLKHPLSGQTNPMLIFEYLRARDPKAVLGYTLERKGPGPLRER